MNILVAVRKQASCGNTRDRIVNSASHASEGSGFEKGGAADNHMIANADVIQNLSSEIAANAHAFRTMGQHTKKIYHP